MLNLIPAELAPAFAAPPSWFQMQVADTYRKGVVFLGWKKGDVFTPRATGFIMSVREHGYIYYYVVTAQHCIGRLYERNDADRTPKVFVSINRKSGPPAVVEAKYEHWFHHPDPDPPVDVAVIGIGLDERVDDFTHGTVGSEIVVSEQMIRDQQISVGDEVFIVGLFRNHSGRQRNIPIVRIGNIAAMPEEPVSTKTGPMDAYLIEARSIGGLSGSPVFVNFGSWRVYGNQSKLYSGYGGALLGLMHGHFDVKDLNSDVVTDEDGTTTGIHSGIGVVVPASKITETLMQDDLKKLRADLAARQNQQSTVTADFAAGEEDAPPASDANPNHLKDFTRLVDVAARKRPQGDQT
jgi:Trypsin-like peptidase domain